MIRHPKKKGFLYFLKRIIVWALLIFGTIKGYDYWRNMSETAEHKNLLDVAKILQNSELKHKKFTPKVQELKVGEISAYLLEEKSNPIVSIAFNFSQAGTAFDAEDKKGLALIASKMITAGAGDYSELEFKEILEENGINLSFGASEDDFSGQLTVPTKNLPIAKKLLTLALAEPKLDENYLQMLKQQILVALDKQSERPENVLNLKFKQYIFKNHPYSRNPLGEKSAIENITTEDIKNFLSNNLGQNKLMVGAAGDISAEQTKELLTEIFAKLPSEVEVNALKTVDFEADGVEYDVERKSPHAITHFVAKGTYRNSADFYPLYIANYILGESGLSSRLSKKVREKEGLTYGIYTYLNIADAKALIEGGFSTLPKDFSKAQEIVKKEWLLMAEKGVSEQEFERAKASLIASFNLRFTSIADIAEMLLIMQKYSLGKDFLDKRNDYVKEVSLREVNAAAKVYFNSVPDFVNIGAMNLEE